MGGCVPHIGDEAVVMTEADVGRIWERLATSKMGEKKRQAPAKSELKFLPILGRALQRTRKRWLWSCRVGTWGTYLL